jgi:hypothetical protein
MPGRPEPALPPIEEKTPMTASTSLLELLLNLLRDPSALTAYREDPEGFLSACGDVSPADVREALLLIQDSQEADFGRDYNTGGNHIQVPPPPAAPEPEPGESNHEAAARYLDSYVTNNYIDDRDTTVDNSVNQQIDTGGGDFDQDIDVDSTVASGDDSVAAGDDIEDSTITTGDDNTVGDDNVTGDDNTVGDDNTDVDVDGGGSAIIGDDNEAVQGDDNTTSFGDGDTTSTEIDGDVSVGDGGAIAAGGDAAVDNSDSSTNDSFNDNSDNSTEDSNNDTSSYTDNSDNSTEDSFNDNSSHSESEYTSDDDSYSDTSATTVDSHDSTQESYDAVV